MTFGREKLMMKTPLRLVVTLLALGSITSYAVAQKAQEPPFQSGRPPLKTRPSGDRDIIRTMADAMGFVRGMGPFQTTSALNRVQWFGTGTMTVGGKTYQVVKYSYAMSLHLNGAREDIQLKSPTGASERRVHAFLGMEAWDETTPGVGQTPVAPKEAANRHLKFLTTPFGFTAAVLKADPSAVKVDDPGAGGKVTISVTLDGTPFTATLNSEYRPATISLMVDGRKIEIRYADYRDLQGYGVMFPTHVREVVDGHPALDLRVDDGRVASYLILQPPNSSGGQ
jgi:hypothetical protein